MEPDPGGQPSADLSAFLEAGPAPVYIGFGSMGSRDPEATAALVLEALRAVLLRGWGGLLPAELPEHVYLSDTVPHTWLFPRMAAVFHHGGAGITAAGLRAGVPPMVVPFFGDQPFWGRLVASLGVGPAPLPRRTLTAGGLAQAITLGTTDGAMRRQAAALGKAIGHEHGLENAAALIGRYGQQLGLG